MVIVDSIVERNDQHSQRKKEHVKQEAFDPVVFELKKKTCQSHQQETANNGEKDCPYDNHFSMEIPG